MPKTLISIRASEETIRRIDELVQMRGEGTTKSEVITIAVDRMFREETQKTEPQQEKAATQGKS